MQIIPESTNSIHTRQFNFVAVSLFVLQRILWPSSFKYRGIGPTCRLRYIWEWIHWKVAIVTLETAQYWNLYCWFKLLFREFTNHYRYKILSFTSCWGFLTCCKNYRSINPSQVLFIGDESAFWSSSGFTRYFTNSFLILSSFYFMLRTGMLPSLTTLYLSHNLFSKQLPLHLGNISALTFLDLSCNGFTGSLPNAYSK